MTNHPNDPYRDEPPTQHGDSPRLLRHAMVVAVVALTIVVGWTMYQSSQEASSDLAPDFRLPLLGETGTFVLMEQQGQTVVVNVWGSWCEPCREEAPMLERLYQDYLDRNVVFVGVAVGDTEASALAFIEEYGITYPNVMDITGQMEQDYQTNGIVPQTIVVNRRGELVGRFVAQPSESQLRQAIEATIDS
jgi:cytochrome c biogenesis protein CcmG/thiol:disulfide interchange protein DsbE